MVDMNEQKALEDATDAVHLLPLEILPLETPGLKKARMVKNAQLESMVELFKEVGTGSGQVPITSLGEVFKSDPEKLKRDYEKLESIAALQSFDVYSLRIDFRRLGVEIDESSQLSLSENKKNELASQMSKFTRPLVMRIYGQSDVEQTAPDISGLFQSADKEQTLKSLNLVAEKLKVPLHEVPDFLEEYGDTFLSLSYYHNELDRITPVTRQFIKAVIEAKKSHQFKTDPQQQKMCKNIIESFEYIHTSLMQRLKKFQEMFNSIWETMEADTFYQIKSIIEQNHKSLGTVLCGLLVKMYRWQERFPNGNPPVAKLGEFMRTEVMTGLQQIYQTEKQAEALLAKQKIPTAKASAPEMATA